MSLINLPITYALHRRALSISREHLRLQRLIRMRNMNCTTQNPAADIESFLFNACFWKAFVWCFPSAGLISKRQRKSGASLFFFAQATQRAADCLGSHQPSEMGKKLGRTRVFFLGSSWKGCLSPTSFIQSKVPAANQTFLYCYLQPALSITEEDFIGR